MKRQHWGCWGTHPQLFHSETQHYWDLKNTKNKRDAACIQLLKLITSIPQLMRFTQTKCYKKIKVMMFVVPTIQLCINFGVLHCFLAHLNPYHLFHPLDIKVGGKKRQHETESVCICPASWLMRKCTQHLYIDKKKQKTITLAKEMPMVPVPQHTSSTMLSWSSWANSPTAEYSTSAAPVFT